MAKELNQTNGQTLEKEIDEIWSVLTPREKRTMNFGSYPASLVVEATEKCGCQTEQVIGALKGRALAMSQAA